MNDGKTGREGERGRGRGEREGKGREGGKQVRERENKG